MSDFAATLGPSKDASTLSESVPTDTGSYTADSTGAWQIWSHALAGAGTNRNNFGQVRKYSSGIKGHQGVDISLPPGREFVHCHLVRQHNNCSQEAIQAGEPTSQ